MAPASQPPRVIQCGKRKSKSGEALKICQPLMIMQMTANAFSQWVTRTSSG